MTHFTPKKISIIIIAVTLLWIGSSLLTGTKRENVAQDAAQTTRDLSKLLKVEEFVAKPYTRSIAINGFTAPNRMVEVKPEVDGKVVELPVKKGTMVEAGQLLVRLDERDRKEMLAQAQATLAARNIEYQASRTLESKGYRPRIGLADSKAALEQAKTALVQAQLAYNNTRIVAPFAGRLEELNVEIGDFLLSGFMGSMDNKVMARIVDDNPIKISGQVSEKDLPGVNKDAEIKVELSDGRLLKGRITFMGQYADMQSRSFPVEVSVDNPKHDVPVGMTATIKLPASADNAYLVSSSVLALDDAGRVGVKLVDDRGIVRFSYVNILANSDDGVWIGGLPDHIRLVTQGQAFVNDGQSVQPPPSVSNSP